jgi:hypothetical protein
MQGFPETCKLFEGFLHGKNAEKGCFNVSPKSNVGLTMHLPKRDLILNQRQLPTKNNVRTYNVILHINFMHFIGAYICERQ